ncbi:class I SAM-dependent methyltransferase [Saccharothrix xinjiangensis]|uniref:Class I SAM-dependent methyltransferase n=1 Tax=Saccharothrix xinjiangensis TaxID=204798 RepID=A0ABV9YAN4_9PSEU
MSPKVDLPDGLVTDVVRASGGNDGDWAGLLAAHDSALIARLLVEEVVSRCPPPVNEAPVLVELAVLDGEREHAWHLGVVRDRPVRVVGADEGFTAMRVDYELRELAQALYGSLRERNAGVRGTTLFPGVTADASAGEKIGAYFLAAQQATETVLTGCDSAKPDLGALSSRYLTPKFGSLHWFTPHYDRHFRDYRGEQVKVLEIGIGGYHHPEWGGGSLRMWKHFFPRGQIYGLDVVDKSHVDELRIRTFQGDQSDAEFLVALAEEHGPFDIVIDDGSHINDHVRTSFQALFPHVRPGGLYVVEDMWTAYWPGFGGNPDPEQSSGTSLGLLKSVIDAIQHRERGDAATREPSYLDGNAVGLHVYHNVAFIEKGRNAESGIPGWIPRDFASLVAASSGGAV